MLKSGLIVTLFLAMVVISGCTTTGKYREAHPAYSAFDVYTWGLGASVGRSVSSNWDAELALDHLRDWDAARSGSSATMALLRTRIYPWSGPVFLGIGTGPSFIAINEPVNVDRFSQSKTTRIGGTKVDQVLHFSLGFLDLCARGGFFNERKSECGKIGGGFSIGGAIGLRNLKPGTVKSSEESTAEELATGYDQAHEQGPSFGYLFGFRIELR
jgi:hypothetical protein